LIVYRVRRLKPFILIGTMLFMVAFGLMIYYRGGPDAYGGIICAQILLGISGGFFPYATQASIQAATNHEHTAVVTGIYLATYNVGSATGNTVSGIIFNQVLPRELKKRLSLSDAQRWYNDPLGLLPDNPIGTPGRDATVEAYKHVQRLLCISGAGVCIFLIGFAFCTRNPALTDSQSIALAEQGIQDLEMLPIAWSRDNPFCTAEERARHKKWWRFWRT
jgi:SIT family siderophore-iron:H+ symporter-like MFS transporter